MSAMETLQFTLGPVQAFVGESRRTRDLWGSSFMLSFLAGQAMAGVLEDARCEVVLPDVREDALLAWIRGDRGGEPPRIGTLPNRFVARCPDARAAAHRAERAMRAAWEKIERAVWERYVAPSAGHGQETRAIWSRQCDGFWEVQWVVGEAPSLLDRRKNWRTHTPTAEPGSKCTMMEGWQELSGWSRSTGKGRTKQDAFWESVRAQGVSDLDLRENERLCALGLIKRLFPLVSKDAIGWECDVKYWPAAAYIAAVPWLERASRLAPEALEEYARQVYTRADRVCSEYHTRIKRLEEARRRWPTRRERSPVILDGNVYNRWGLARVPGLDEAALEELRAGLKRVEGALRAKVDTAQEAAASPFYGLLLMDGDSMGKLLRPEGGVGVEPVTRALGAFAGVVRGCVDTHDGVLIYAGGDDVLALVPVDTALACAQALARAYGEAFRGVLGERYEAWSEHATLSGGLVFAHSRTPMGTVLSEAHRLLDDDAKDGNGRASLAVSVFKPSGVACRWVTTWARLASDEGEDNAREGATVLGGLRDLMRDRELSSSLIYRLREDMSVLCGWLRWEPGLVGRVGVGETVEARREAALRFVTSVMSHSLEIQRGEEASQLRERAEQMAKRLLDASCRARRETVTIEGAGLGPREQFEHTREEDTFGIDAALLARFIHQGGWEDR